MDALRTLEILITSRTPFIAIETLEEDRVEQALERVAQRLNIPLFVWTMTRGLRRAGALEPLYDTQEPLKAPRVELPSELATLASLVKLELPTEEDLRALAQEVFGTLSRQHRLGPPPDPDILDKIASALRGLTLFEIGRAH